MIHGNTLSCPKCGCKFMHRQSVELFERMEDDESGVHLEASYSSIETDSNLEDNPSSRRSGMTIHFECEQGCQLQLHIAQHKGEERLGWEYDQPT